MEPTVFCLVVPLALNICSTPMDYDPLPHIRPAREISVTTDKENSEGKIINTAQTDKQLIINIETKVVPQFNVYMDSLQESPRMQCTSDKQQGQHIFTCLPLSIMCCPSTITCICSTDQPTAAPTTLPPLVPDTPECKELCHQCTMPTAEPTHLVPHSPQCEDLCRQCSTPPTPECSTPAPTPVVTDSPTCLELCQLCHQCTTSTTPDSPKCLEHCQLCHQCTTPTVQPTHLVPHSPQCEDLCKKCQVEPTAGPPEPKCIDCDVLCKMCGVDSKPDGRKKRQVNIETANNEPVIINIEREKSDNSSIKINIKNCKQCTTPRPSLIPWAEK